MCGDLKSDNEAHLVDEIRNVERLVDLRHEILLLRLLHLRHLNLQLLDAGYVLGSLQFRDQVGLLNEERL